MTQHRPRGRNQAIRECHQVPRMGKVAAAWMEHAIGDAQA